MQTLATIAFLLALGLIAALALGHVVADSMIEPRRRERLQRNVLDPLWELCQWVVTPLALPLAAWSVVEHVTQGDWFRVALDAAGAVVWCLGLLRLVRARRSSMKTVSGTPE